MESTNDGRYRHIAKKIVYYRNLREISQDELADKIAISKSYLSKIEAPNSTKTYSLDVLFAIADGLEVNVIQFFMPIKEKE